MNEDLHAQDGNAENRRLRDLCDRWFDEPLGLTFPSLGVDLGEPAPTTYEQFLRSWHMQSSFATVDPAASDEGARANLEHFGVENPAAVIVAVGTQFKSAAEGGQIDSNVLKDAFVILDVYCADRATLVQQYAPEHSSADPLQHDINVADGQAARRAQDLIGQLAKEFGIALPTSNRR